MVIVALNNALFENMQLYENLRKFATFFDRFVSAIHRSRLKPPEKVVNSFKISKMTN